MSSKTYLSEVYEEFLSSISDYTILKSKDESYDEFLERLEKKLFVYFTKAKRRFYKCKQNLNTLEDENGTYFGYKDDDGNIVNVELTGYEIAILSNLMLVEYMKPIVLSTEVLKQSLSDKDFKIYSQANQLRELSLLYRTLRRESQKMITEYSYIGMTDNEK